MKRGRITWVLFTSILAVSSLVRAERFSELVVFGDSFSDNGNVYSRMPSAVPSPPYFDGRFSNGPLWFELLAERFGAPAPTASENGGTNYAWGGATTGAVSNPWGFPNMDSQVETYLTSGTPDSSQLFIFWGGENDFFFGQTDPSESVQYLSNQISSLSTAGAKNFLVLNLPTDNRSTLVPQFNDLLSQELVNISRSDTSLSIFELDYASLELAMIAEPALFGFTNVVDPACINCDSAAPEIVPNPDEYRRWDEWHLTARTNQVIANAGYDLLIPEPSAITLALLSIVFISARRKRRSS